MSVSGGIENLAVHDLKLLRALVAVAREGNVTRAAELLNLTQPALSMQLRKLSELTELTLFRRSAQGMDLTAEGAMLAVKAEQVLAAAQDFNQLLRTMRSQLRGTLRIGTIIDPEFTRLGALLQRLLETAPGVSTSLRHGVSGEVLDQIARDALDVGFYLGELPAGEEGRYHSRHLSRLSYRVVAPPALAQKARGMDWAGLARLPWVGTPPSSVHNRLLSHHFAACGVEQNIVALVDQEASMLAMARTGVGLCLCRDSIALHEAQSGTVVILDQPAARDGADLPVPCRSRRGPGDSRGAEGDRPRLGALADAVPRPCQLGRYSFDQLSLTAPAAIISSIRLSS